MSRNKKLKYTCVYPFKKKLDRYIDTYEETKKYVFKTNEACLVFSPNGVHVASYMKNQWYSVH